MLIQLEAMLLVLTGITLALLFLWSSMMLFRDYLVSEYGLFIASQPFSSHIMTDILWILMATFVITLIPGINAYRRSLHINLR